MAHNIKLVKEACLLMLVCAFLTPPKIDVFAEEKLSFRIQRIGGEWMCALVKRYNTTEWINATVDMIINEGDKISTGGKTMVVMCKQPNGSIVKLHSLSDVTVSEFMIVEDGRIRTDIITIGTIRVKTLSSPQRTDMKISLPTATCGVRGTTFSANQTGSTCYVEAFDGTVEVNSTVTGETVYINGYGDGTGQRATVYNSSDPIYVESLNDMDTSVGGEWDLDQYLDIVGGISIPIAKLGLLAPYIGLASTIIAATVASVVYFKRVKHRKEKQ